MGEGEGGIRRGAPRGPLGEGGIYYIVAGSPSLGYLSISIL